MIVDGGAQLCYKRGTMHHPGSHKSHRLQDGDTASIQAFFDAQWTLYQKLMRNDYLFHTEVYAVLHRFLKSHFTKPYSFLDLGCGDAAFSSKALHGTLVSHYEGVDLSEVALALARKNMASLTTEKKFTEGNFHEDIAKRKTPADAILIGLSLHHLHTDGKADFMKRCHPLLRPGGVFFVFDPFCAEGETRDAYVKRWLVHIDKTWKDLTPAEIILVRDHILSCDFPESVSTEAGFAKKAGFARTETLWKSPDGFYGLLAFIA